MEQFQKRDHYLIESLFECSCGFKTSYHDLFVEHLLKKENTFLSLGDTKND